MMLVGMGNVGLDGPESSKVVTLYRLNSLDRAVAVLQLLSESDIPLTLAEISRRLHLRKSTAHRSLMVLERSALIERTIENGYRLGLKLYELGNRAAEQDSAHLSP